MMVQPGTTVEPVDSHAWMDEHATHGGVFVAPGWRYVCYCGEEWPSRRPLAVATVRALETAQPPAPSERFTVRGSLLAAEVIDGKLYTTIAVLTPERAREYARWILDQVGEA